MGDCQLFQDAIFLNPKDADGRKFEPPEVGDMWKILTETFDGEMQVKSVTVPGWSGWVMFTRTNKDFYNTPLGTDVFLGDLEPNPEEGNIFVGHRPISNVFFGGSPVSKMYVGGTQVYPAYEGDGEPPYRGAGR